MKIKTSELIDKALDWAVAKCEGKGGDCEFHAGNLLYGRVTSGFVQYRPSTDWAQGGPIIEREKIETYWHTALEMWAARHDDNLRYGPTPLIAAMRCHVLSTLGDVVEIPDELIKG